MPDDPDRRGARCVAAVATVTLGLACTALAEPAAQPTGAFDRGRLFRIDRQGLAPSYVYGTLHSNDPRVVALPPAVGVRAGASRAAAFESLLLEADVATFLAAARYDDGRRLADHVDAATLERDPRNARAATAPIGDASSARSPGRCC